MEWEDRLAGISNAPAKAYPEKRGRETGRFNLFVDVSKVPARRRRSRQPPCLYANQNRVSDFNE
jgi:hypothetical protein